MNLFAYGSLMCRDIMADVSGYHGPGQPAVARGYSRRSVQGESYPAMVPDEAGDTDGVIYLDLPDSAWARLDRFEGDLYVRQALPVALGDGRVVSAEAYVVRAEHLDRLGASLWRFDDFLREGKAVFQQEYKGFSALTRA
jgi:gamma-glutamylcyclotransferase (GGCT)/AIG2-like uncharacterized protein YtfP